MSTETIRLIRDGDKGGGGAEGVRSGGGGRLYTSRYIVTTRMTSALRWAAMRAILMFHNCEGQSYKTVFTDHNILKQIGTEVLLLTNQIPYRCGQTGSHLSTQRLV